MYIPAGGGRLSSPKKVGPPRRRSHFVIRTGSCTRFKTLSGHNTGEKIYRQGELTPVESCRVRALNHSRAYKARSKVVTAKFIAPVPQAVTQELVMEGVGGEGGFRIFADENGLQTQGSAHVSSSPSLKKQILYTPLGQYVFSVDKDLLQCNKVRGGT